MDASFRVHIAVNEHCPTCDISTLIYAIHKHAQKQGAHREVVPGICAHCAKKFYELVQEAHNI